MSPGTGNAIPASSLDAGSGSKVRAAAMIAAEMPVPDADASPAAGAGVAAATAETGASAELASGTDAGNTTAVPRRESSIEDGAGAALTSFATDDKAPTLLPSPEGPPISATQASGLPSARIDMRSEETRAMQAWEGLRDNESDRGRPARAAKAGACAAAAELNGPADTLTELPAPGGGVDPSAPANGSKTGCESRRPLGHRPSPPTIASAPAVLALRASAPSDVNASLSNESEVPPAPDTRSGVRPGGVSRPPACIGPEGGDPGATVMPETGGATGDRPRGAGAGARAGAGAGAGAGAEAEIAGDSRETGKGAAKEPDATTWADAGDKGGGDAGAAVICACTCEAVAATKATMAEAAAKGAATVAGAFRCKLGDAGAVAPGAAPLPTGERIWGALPATLGRPIAGRRN